MKNKFMPLTLILSLFLSIFTLSGCSKIKDDVTAVNKDLISKTIKEYIAQKTPRRLENSKVFCDYKILGAKEENDITTLYLWVQIEELYKENNEIKIEWGEVSPIIVKLEKSDDSLKVIDYENSDEIEESEAIKIFPKEIQKIVTSRDFHKTLNLGKSLAKEAEEYFKTK